MSNGDLERLMGLFRKHNFDPQVDVDTMRGRLDRFARSYPPRADTTVEATVVAELPAERITAGDGPEVLYFHGGGYVTGSLRSHRHLAARLAADLAGTVHLVEYRLAPEAPFPAAFHDCVAAYAALSDRAISLAGDSAGGGLAFATAIAARDRGLPRPRSIVGISPWVNLATEHDSYDLLAPLDAMLSREVAEWHAQRYLAGQPVVAASPLFADLTGLPPTLIQIGDREVFFGDAVRMHMALLAAGADAELSVWKEMFHVWHLYWPELAEGRAAITRIADFVRHHHQSEKAI